MSRPFTVNTRDGRVIVNPANIVKVEEAGVSGKWHGTQAYIKLTDGSTVESQTSIAEIEKMIEEGWGG